MCFHKHLPSRVALLPLLPLLNRCGLINLCVVIVRTVILAAVMGTECAGGSRLVPLLIRLSRNPGLRQEIT